MTEVTSKSDFWFSPEEQAALGEFHKVFGRTLAAWSGIEEGLFEWFKACTGLQEQLARTIYYSVRSFIGRRDLLVAALALSRFDERTRNAIHLCTKRARTYSEFRNRIAHGHIVFDHGQVPPQHVFMQGRTMSGPEHDPAVTIAELTIAAENFEKLGELLLGFHPEWQSAAVCEAGCLEEIQSLPSVANSKEPSQIRS
jgi:hypothetical protein